MFPAPFRPSAGFVNHPRSPLAEVALRFTTEAGHSLVFTVDPFTRRVEVKSGDLADIAPGTREAILVGVLNGVELEQAWRTD